MMYFTVASDRRAALALLTCSSLCLMLCPPGVAAPGVKKGIVGSSAPPVMGGAGQGMTISLPDPKLPGTGKLLYYLRAAASDGQFLPDGSFHGGVTKLWMRLYQKGVPSAVLTAPQAQGGGTSKATVITGKGGVVVKSLTEPGTFLTADTVVWYSSLNRIVATGHVFYHNSKNGMTSTGPFLQGDTKLGTFATHAGHMTGTF